MPREEELGNLMAAAIYALADLKGIMPDYEPSGDRLHPGWSTIEELEDAIGKLLDKQEEDNDAVSET